MALLSCCWCATTACVWLWQCDFFWPNSSHLLPFPCQFDELLGTDHLVSGKYFTSEVEEDNFRNLKYRMLVLWWVEDKGREYHILTKPHTFPINGKQNHVISGRGRLCMRWACLLVSSNHLAINSSRWSIGMVISLLLCPVVEQQSISK